MIAEYDERISSSFEGTIIDIETIGEFSRFYKYDSRQYKDMIQVIFGYMNQEHLHIYCAKDGRGIKELKEMTPKTVETLVRPLYAFNCEFESGVWFHHVGLELRFDGELNKEKYEKKKDTVRLLGIPNYDDPFFDNGFMCIEAWNNGEFSKVIAHNRSCLLKERDILLKRGYRESGELEFIWG